TLPDNLTTYRIMVVMSDVQRRAGSGDARVTLRKPLMVQPTLPRFVYPGDRFSLEALVFNGSEREEQIEIAAMNLAGLTAQGELVSRASVKPGASTTFKLPVTVNGRGELVMRLSAKMGKATDEVEVKLPILDAGAKQQRVASAQVRGSDAVTIPLPAERLPGSTEVEVTVSTTALSELGDSVRGLMTYPNGCIEQTTSTAYPLVVLKDLLPEMGVTVDEKQLRAYAEAGIKRLLSFQTTSGGLAYWPGSDAPHAFGTTFGLTALIEGKKRGFEVPDEALKRMGDYLETSLRQGAITEEMPHASMADGDTRALMVLTLNRLGRAQPAYVSTLFREKEKLTPFGLAMLAVTVSEGGGDKALAEPLLAAVRKAATENPTEAWYEGARAQGWSMGSPLRTHAAALLAFADPKAASDGAGKLLTGLLKRKTSYGIWGNTQENVYGIMGVARLVGARAAGKAPQLKLSVAGASVPVSAMQAVTPSLRRYSVPAEQLGVREGAAGLARVAMESGSGTPTFLTVRAKYEMPLTPKNRLPQVHGFTVSRRYEDLEGRSLEGKKVPLGSVLRVRLSVVSDKARNYVAIDDKLPAGLEPLNTNLATTEKVSLGPADEKVLNGLKTLSFQETRDARVAFFADELPAGSYDYVYLARATTPGKYLRPGASAEAMYDPNTTGRSAIDEVEVAP
ncbi:MAG: alpha-2-macroglobulin family protein, partial [Myxococcaceae bacterium]